MQTSLYFFITCSQPNERRNRLVDALQRNDSYPKSCKTLHNHGLHDGEIGVVVVVYEQVSHPGNLIPRNFRLSSESVRINVFYRFANLHESSTARVLDNALVEIATIDVLINCVDSDGNVREPLIVASRHKRTAWATISSLTKGRRPRVVQTSTLTPSSSSSSQPSAKMSSGLAS